MKIEKIRLIESPKEDYSLAQSEMATLLGGADFACPGTYYDGGTFGGTLCKGSYDNTKQCGDATDYCGAYKSCTLHYAW